MNYEIIGTIASVFVLIAMCSTNIKRLRIIDCVGAIIFVVYGILIKSFSVTFLNILIFIVQIYRLIRDWKYV